MEEQGQSQEASRVVKMRNGEEMISNGKVARGQVKKSNGKVTRGQVQKSNGKVKTRIVWQGKRYDVKSNG